MSDDHVATGFMCGVDFNYELGQALGGNTIFPSEADLIANKGCTDECGIVEVEVRLKRVIKEEDHSIKPEKSYRVVTRDKNGKRSAKTVTGKELLEGRRVITFTYQGVTYSSNWHEGYVRLPDGRYLGAANWVDGKPENITQFKLMVAPAQYAEAKQVG